MRKPSSLDSVASCISIAVNVWNHLSEMSHYLLHLPTSTVFQNARILCINSCLVLGFMHFSSYVFLYNIIVDIDNINDSTSLEFDCRMNDIITHSCNNYIYIPSGLLDTFNGFCIRTFRWSLYQLTAFSRKVAYKSWWVFRVIVLHETMASGVRPLEWDYSSAQDLHIQ